MTRPQQESLARKGMLLSLAIVVICVGYLLGDYAFNRYHSPGDKSLVKTMEQEVKTDAQVSLTLTAERDRQTLQSMARDSGHKTIGWILIAASAGFLGCMNWQKSFQVKPVLPFEKLVALQIEAGSAAAPAGARDRSEVTPPEIDLTIVDRIVEQEGRSPEAAIPILRAVQVEYGYLPDEALRRVCDLTEITPAQIAGTSSFYAQFRRSPVGKHIVKVCHGTACHVSGIVQITEELHRHLELKPGEDTDPSRLFTLENVACLGCCSLAPVIMIDEDTVGRLTPASACHALDAVEAGEVT